ncbi:Hypothetical protein GSB_151715 [Giardia duodenalis]|uniref:Uncharacterized protein n=1 Tax=Giardia intestinalis TaxID=5741 RepID=V6TZ23_GIAIN|nr:Hypothetical protein GSB_151715 [Giardia intestinalis]
MENKMTLPERTEGNTDKASPSFIQCVLCGVEFSRWHFLPTLFQHAVYCHGIQTFKDLLCYFNKNSTQQNTHTLCNLCHTIYPKNLLHNMDEHSVNGTYYCHLCDFTTTTFRLYESHPHKINPQLFWCTGCHATFISSQYAKIHLEDCCRKMLSYQGNCEVITERAPTNTDMSTAIELIPKPYSFSDCDHDHNKDQSSLVFRQIIDRYNERHVISFPCRFCSKLSSIKCQVCPVCYCDDCKQCDPYLYMTKICMHCYMHAYSVWNDPILVFTKGLFGILSGFTRPKGTTSPRNRHGLAMHGPYVAKAGAIVSEALALAVPIDRLNIPYGLERLVEATQYDDDGMPCFLADFGPYVFFAGSVIVPPLYFARDSPDPLCRLEVTLLAGLEIGYPVAVVTLRAVRDFEVGKNKVREITIRRQCLTEYPWRGAAHLCLDPILAIPPQHRPTALPPGTPCPKSAFSQYFAGRSPFKEPTESLVTIQ